MENARYEYSPIINRKLFKLPGGARVAVWVDINIEHFNVDTVEYGGAGNFKIPPPNVFDYSLRDYGNRIGIWRFMEVMDKYSFKASAALNSDVCKHYLPVVEECQKRGWEFLGHGINNALLLGGKTEEEERRIIRTTLDVIAEATGKRPVGWIGPALQETFNTLDILAEEGIKYVCDWVSDDQPFIMKVKKGSLVSIPFSVDINDIPAFTYHHSTPLDFCNMIKDQFDTLYREGEHQARVMCITLHPYLIGQAYRIGWLEKALQHIKSHADIWLTTSGEIADWYYEKYPGDSLLQR